MKEVTCDSWWQFLYSQFNIPIQDKAYDAALWFDFFALVWLSDFKIDTFFFFPFEFVAFQRRKLLREHPQKIYLLTVASS